ncbi:MAG: hypothetical protein FD187_1860 [bacterium]|nr:MAG: hypothetical protein FD142_1748 [bacterium]KAF0148437.1 MAG: hypothetical protein FD187_1860 [bacterium]KAF0167981.1 MAG: hypothetical protein FD158_1708 [bacterium]TXT21276.1 MAG: hypothetical protein FD132_786 [bacterium]
MLLTGKDGGHLPSGIALRERTIQRSVATSARYDRRIGRVVIALSSGLEIAFRPHDAQGLERARPGQLKAIEISSSGLGIHFPDLDANLYLPVLLEGFLGSGDTPVLN